MNLRMISYRDLTRFVIKTVGQFPTLNQMNFGGWPNKTAR